MNWKISLILVVMTLGSCKQERASEEEVSNFNYLIEADELKTIINAPNLKLIDFRRKENYVSEHLTGALNIWRDAIEDTAFPYGGMMASKTQIEQLFGSLGIKNDDTLVIYDDSGLCDAARLWWILQNYDFKRVRLLNGGLSAWKSMGGSITSETPEITKTEFTLVEHPSMKTHISKNKVLEALGGASVILDTRTTDEYSGKRQKRGAAKGGKIPNSVHIDWTEAIHYEGDMRIKSVEELTSIYNTLNIDKNDTIIVYCHSGVRSAHTTFVLTELLGYKNVKNFDGSWTEWSHFKELPFEQDSLTIITK